MNRTECYQILGVKPGASNAEIKTAYRDLVKVWHPDRFTSNPRLQEKASETMKQVNVAYDTLESAGPCESPSSRPSRPRPAERPCKPRQSTRPPERRAVQAGARFQAPRGVSYVGFWEGLTMFLGVLAAISPASGASKPATVRRPLGKDW
jgi:hypothetical protein